MILAGDDCLVLTLYQFLSFPELQFLICNIGDLRPALWGGHFRWGVNTVS